MGAQLAPGAARALSLHSMCSPRLWPGEPKSRPKGYIIRTANEPQFRLIVGNFPMFTSAAHCDDRRI
jgi:hypothetical protein